MISAFDILKTFYSLVIKNKKIKRQLLTVDLLARASMKNAANCDT